MADPNPLAGMPLAESLANNMNESLQWMTRMWGGSAQAQSSLAPGLPSMLMPTLDPEELDKRITDLRTVAHWLDMNRALLHTTIQALEMQRTAILAMRSMAGSGATGADSARPRGEGAVGSDPVAFNPALWWNALHEQFVRVASAAASDAQPASRPQDPQAPGAPERNPSGS